ncbi:type I polyketide synthase [Variovorax sp. J22R115]|uniref:type I polyketide synthase n=1 Tax=Variovorax sp. J22R115 TaxID=3053509 RepID=UPI0025781F9F|nr:type I polyketide synthase [Variovorax sp. J22R115]MDM0053603.1 type I polyketide synthase [Variovorax sp. J22R115]
MGLPSSSQRVVAALRQARARLEAAERAASEPIAVIGMGCRFPGGANGPDAFWERLLAGFDAVGPIPHERYDVASYYDPTPATPGAIYTREGAFVEDIERFDAAFFGISPREAVLLDPQQRLLLEVSWEALEHAGQAPDRLRGSRTGVFVGIGRSDYSQHLLHAATPSLTAWHATGNGLCYGPGRLAHVLDLKGPNLAVDTACSSSLLAVHLACQSLRLRECDLALTAGCHVHLSPQVAIMMSMSRALAADGRCKAFDVSADGFGQGEGCGVVVLRRLSDALDRGDTILALLRGSAVNHDGHSSGLTVPNQAAQEQVIRAALANARVQAGEIGYVEAHGTGTPLGDPIEVEALAAVLCGTQRGRDDALRIGSVKTNIGHLEAAAGIAGLIKVVLALTHRTIPPHLHLRQPNPRIDWDALSIAVPTHPTAWPRAGTDAASTLRLAGVSSFGMSGTNAHVVVQAAPPVEPRPAACGRPVHLIALSARSASALRAQATRFEAHLHAHLGLALADIGYSANTGRTHFPVRVGLVASSPDELARGLSAVAAGDTEPGVAPDEGAEAPGVAFLFSGQGAQYLQMGRGLYQTEPLFRRVLDRCDDVLSPLLRTSLVRLMHSDADDRRLDQTGFTQPALFALEYALAELWQSWGVVPRAVLGHSVGEYVAACVAGVFGFEDGLRLVAERARLMQALPGGAMAAVHAGEQRVRYALASCGELVAHQVAIAAVNGDASVVVAGPPEPLRAVLARLAAEGISARALNVSHAFHSPTLDPVLAPLADAARQIVHQAPRVDLITNVSGRLQARALGAHDWATYWAMHARQPVRFADGLDTLRRCGVRICVEIGPGGTLLGLAGRHFADDPPVLLPSLLPGRDDGRTMLSSLARLHELGVPVDWDGVDRGRARRRVALPTYPFERQRYWSDAAMASPSESPARVPLPAYRLTWLRQSPAPVATSSALRHWLVIDDEGGLGERTAAALARQGARVRVARADAGVERLLAQSHAQGILWACDSAEALGPSAPAEALLAAQVHDCAALLQLVRAIAASSATRCADTRLWIVTRGAVAVEPAAMAPGCSSACVRGFARTIALEHPEFWGGTIDVATLASDADLAAVAAEIALSGIEDAVAIRAGQRFVARVEPLPEAGVPGGVRALRADATYLITGGLGALGLRVADWMVGRGAAHLVLAGRNLPSPPARAAVAELQRRGATVVVTAADTASGADLQRVFDDIGSRLPPLGGIVHAAGVYGHEPLESLTPAAIEAVLRPKVAGAWLLHQLTATLDLDLFVLYSSVAATWGSKGQAHYAAANAFLDALAAHRRGLGLPALSIAWGPWNDAGMATGRARDWLARVGVRALAPADALAAMERHLGTLEPHIAVADVDWPRFREVYEAGRERPLLARLWPQAPEPSMAAAAPGARLEADYATLTPAARRDWLLGHLQRRVAGVLGLGESERPDVRKGFFRMGMDSLMAIELRNRLARDFGITLSSTIVFDRPTIAEMADWLATEALGWADAPAAAPAPTPVEALPHAIEARIARLESLVRAS